MNNQKFIVSLIVCAVLCGGGGYYLGMKKNSLTASVGAEERGAGFAGNRQSGAGGARGLRAGGSFNGGEIVSIDAESMSVKSPDGSSKIIFYGVSTPIMMMASGTPQDLSVGKNVVVNGKANPDGSITAESIQLRPQGQNRPAGVPVSQ